MPLSKAPHCNGGAFLRNRNPLRTARGRRPLFSRLQVPIVCRWRNGCRRRRPRLRRRRFRCRSFPQEIVKKWDRHLGGCRSYEVCASRLGASPRFFTTATGGRCLRSRRFGNCDRSACRQGWGASPHKDCPAPRTRRLERQKMTVGLLLVAIVGLAIAGLLLAFGGVLQSRDKVDRRCRPRKPTRPRPSLRPPKPSKRGKASNRSIRPNPSRARSAWKHRRRRSPPISTTPRRPSQERQEGRAAEEAPRAQAGHARGRFRSARVDEESQ